MATGASAGETVTSFYSECPGFNLLDSFFSYIEVMRHKSPHLPVNCWGTCYANHTVELWYADRLSCGMPIG